MTNRPNASSVLVLALIAYCVYEHQEETGKATQIRVDLQRRSFGVEDDGRGIGLHREGYVVGLIEQLSPRRSEVALHGIGLAIAAMSAPSVLVESRRDGFLRRQHFAWGVAQGPVHAKPWAGASGTRVTLTLADDAPDIDVEAVMAQVEAWRAGHPGLKIVVSVEGVAQ